MKFLLQFLVIILLVSCQKNEFEFIPDQTYVINRDLLLANLVGSPTSYIIDVTGEKTVFFGYDHTIVEIPSKSLVDETGSPITGSVKMEIKEYTTSKSNLLQCPSSEYNMSILNSDKLIFVKFSKDGKDVYPDKKINIYLAEQSMINDPMILAGSLTDNKIVWSRVNESLAKVNFGQWSVSSNEAQTTISGYKIELKGSPRWISISEKSSQSNTSVQHLDIEINQNLYLKNTLAYFVADDKNTVLQLVWNESKSKFGLNINTQSMNFSGKIVIISQLGVDNFEFGMTNAILGIDTTIKVSSSKKDIKEIKSILKSI